MAEDSATSTRPVALTAATPALDDLVSCLARDAVAVRELTPVVSPLGTCGLDTLGNKGATAAKVNSAAAQKTAIPASKKSIATQWSKWSENQRFTHPPGARTTRTRNR